MGVFGIIGEERTNVASSVYYGLFALQHRGQESSGIVVNDDGVFTMKKNQGLVNDVFTHADLDALGLGNMAIGHVRYGTLGTKSNENTEPIIVNHMKGRLAIATAGRLSNAAELKHELELAGMIFHTSSDAEIVSYVITRERITAKSIEEATCRAMSRFDGGLSLLLMSPRKIIATRDKYGFHPVCYGKRENGQYVVATESCALDTVGATFIRELEPGEIIVFTNDGTVKSIREHCGKAPESLCVFEYVYTSRPDSVIASASVHEARKRAGALLAEAHPVEADVVVGVPDSGLDAAIGYAERSGIPYGIGLIKNKYIGRTFIAPGQDVREDKVKIKLNPVSATVSGKRVVLVDDSIVRGTTCAKLVRLLKNAGALEVHLRSSAPPFLNPCYYGTDVDSKDSLIASNHTVEEITKITGADSLGYLRLEDVTKLAVGSTCKGYCTACFDGKYPTAIPEKIEENKYDRKLSEKK
ncbi:MAG: amidophosphoribosyltransferase [Ruminococcaceae bacterium]|nr:amidophosphoribosyltransferase [Oscillospiraceae bacterium]